MYTVRHVTSVGEPDFGVVQLLQSEIVHRKKNISDMFLSFDTAESSRTSSWAYLALLRRFCRALTSYQWPPL
eukprot:29249-Eustigmatos_ZCMA.PRE.1